MLVCKTESGKRGFSLLEILTALIVMALIFFPVMNLMMTGIAATEKDVGRVTAMQLCQQKMDEALRLPYDFFSDKLNTDISGVIADPSSPVASSDGTVIDLGNQMVNGLEFFFNLRVEPRDVEFAIQEVNYPPDDDGIATSSVNWTFQSPIRLACNNRLRRYTLRVSWYDKPQTGSSNTELLRFYSLVSFKSDLENAGK